MSMSTHRGFRQALEQRQRLGQRGQAAVQLLGLSFEEAEAMIAAEVLSNPVLQPVARAASTPISEIIENTLAEAISLSDHLIRQVGELTDITPSVRECLRYLIGCLDERGYLCDQPDWIEAVDGAQALKLLRGLEPAGVGARDLLDCFALQLKREGVWSSVWRQFFERPDLLEKQDFAALARHLGLGNTDLRAMMAKLRTLSSAPGQAFSASAPVAPPDLMVKSMKSGETLVELVHARRVRAKICPEAVEALRSIERNPNHAAYVKDQFEHARWVRRICQQRVDTLLRVARHAVAIQHEAIHQGLAAMRPLTLRETAEILDMHESTVSRAVAHKAIETPIGVIALRDLFSAPSGKGESCVTAVRASIQKLIDGERAGRVLSDEDIASQLAPSGIRLSRRSVAKHRAAMGVAGARVRARRQTFIGDHPG